MSCPSKPGYPNCCYQISLIIQTIVLLYILISMLSLRKQVQKFFFVFFSQRLEDVTQLPCSEPRFPPHTSGRVLLTSSPRAFLFKLYKCTLIFLIWVSFLIKERVLLLFARTNRDMTDICCTVRNYFCYSITYLCAINHF